jgi:hypothetical protein
MLPSVDSLEEFRDKLAILLKGETKRVCGDVRVLGKCVKGLRRGVESWREHSRV